MLEALDVDSDGRVSMAAFVASVIDWRAVEGTAEWMRAARKVFQARLGISVLVLVLVLALVLVLVSVHETGTALVIKHWKMLQACVPFSLFPHSGHGHRLRLSTPLHHLFITLTPSPISHPLLSHPGHGHGQLRLPRPVEHPVDPAGKPATRRSAQCGGGGIDGGGGGGSRRLVREADGG